MLFRFCSFYKSSPLTLSWINRHLQEQVEEEKGEEAQ